MNTPRIPRLNKAGTVGIAIALLAGLLVLLSWHRLSVEIQIRHLSSDDPVVAEAAADSLVRDGKHSIGPLITRLQDQVPFNSGTHLDIIKAATMRKRAAVTLGRIGDTIAVEPLIQSLIVGSMAPDDEAANKAAFDALATFGSRAVDPLIDHLRDKEGNLRAEAARVLGMIGDSRAVIPLTVRLKEEEYASARIKIIDALGMIGDKGAIQGLSACLYDQKPVVRIATANALLSLGYNPKDVEARSQYLFAQRRFDEVAEMGYPGITLLISYFRNYHSRQWNSPNWESPHAKEDDRAVAKVLAKLGDIRAVDGLVNYVMASSMSHSDLLDATGDVAEFGGALVEPLIKRLNGEELSVTSHAAEVLGMLGDSRAAKSLINWFEHGDVLQRQSAASALGELSRRGQTDEQVTKTLARYLDGFGSNGDLWYFAMQALGWETTKEILLLELKNENGREAQRVISTFIAIGNESIASELVHFLDTKGNKALAEIYLNCGHSGLSNAAEVWAQKRGFSIWKTQESAKVRWGSLR